MTKEYLHIHGHDIDLDNNWEKLAQKLAENPPKSTYFDDAERSREWGQIFEVRLPNFRVCIDIRALNWDPQCARSCVFGPKARTGLWDTLTVRGIISYDKLNNSWEGTWQTTAEGIQRLGQQSGFEVEYRVVLTAP